MGLVFLEQPEHFKVKNRRYFVWKLMKSIYGLSESGKAWYKVVDKALIDLELQRLVSDPFVYVNKQMDLIVALYVMILVFGAARKGSDSSWNEFRKISSLGQ